MRVGVVLWYEEWKRDEVSRDGCGGGREIFRAQQLLTVGAQSYCGVEGDRRCCAAASPSSLACTEGRRPVEPKPTETPARWALPLIFGGVWRLSTLKIAHNWAARHPDGLDLQDKVSAVQGEGSTLRQGLRTRYRSLTPTEGHRCLAPLHRPSRRSSDIAL